MTADEIAALPPAADDGDELPASKSDLSAEAAQPNDDLVQIALGRSPLPPPPVNVER